MNMPNLSPEEGSGECWEQTIYAFFAEKQRRPGLLRTVKAFHSSQSTFIWLYSSFSGSPQGASGPSFYALINTNRRQFR